MTKRQAFNTFETKTREALKAVDKFPVYKKSTFYDLRDVYGSYSIYKERAFENCKELCEALGGSGMKILSANSQAFTVGFTFPHPDFGCDCFAYITKDYNRFCFV